MDSRFAVCSNFYCCCRSTYELKPFFCGIIQKVNKLDGYLYFCAREAYLKGISDALT